MILKDKFFWQLEPVLISNHNFFIDFQNKTTILQKCLLWLIEGINAEHQLDYLFPATYK